MGKEKRKELERGEGGRKVGGGRGLERGGGKERRKVEGEDGEKGG